MPALAEVAVSELAPGLNTESDEMLLALAEETGTFMYHPVGTCSMGRSRESMVDPRLRVHGVMSLRVIDASIMPTMVSGNTNGPAIMIEGKGAAMVIEDQQNRR